MKIKSLNTAVIILSFMACKKAEISFGTEFIDNEYTQIVKVDSFGVTLSTVLIDSFATSAKGTCLVGSYIDPYLGTITAKTYFDIALSAYSDIYQNTTFDSLIIIGKVNKNYCGDSTKPLRLNIARLAEDIVPPNAGSSLYNTSSFATYPSFVGSKELTIKPNVTDTFFIRLSDILGKELMGMLQRKSDTVKNTTLFTDYLKGFCISSSTANAMIFGFSDSMKLRLHYKQSGLFLENKYVDFTINNTTHQFNNITINRIGTALQSLSVATPEIYSNNTSNMAFTQPTACVMAKLRFPTVKEILKLPNLKKILKAQLVIKPIEGSYTSIFPLPPEIRLARTTHLNFIGEDISILSSDGTTKSQTGDLYIDYLMGQNTTYTYDVTSYIKEVIATEGYTQNGLLVLPPSTAYETSFKRLVFGDRYRGSMKIELQLYYITIQ